MDWRSIGLAAALCGIGAGAALAQTQPGGDPGRATGVDVMGDKARSGPDGWVQAPQSRTQSPGATSPSEGSGNRATDPSSIPNPQAGKPMNPGEDPGTPARTESRGPGVIDAPSAPR